MCVFSVMSDSLQTHGLYSPPGSSVHGIVQARILARLAIFSSRGSSQPRDQTCIFCVSCISRRILHHCCHLGSPWILSKEPLGSEHWLNVREEIGGIGL